MKRAALGASVAITLPFYLFYRVNALFFNRELAFQGVSQLLSLLPGISGNFVRRGFYYMALKRCSPEFTVSFGTRFATANCEIGSHVYVGTGGIISNAVIGDDVLIGCNVHILSGKNQHDFSSLDVPIRLQKMKMTAVRIGEDSWIGNCAVIMANVGRKCVVGAGSVVTRDVEDYSVVAGNPARVIRKRA